MIPVMNDSQIVQRAALHCRSLLSRFLPSDLYFHNLEHTQEVVLACQFIAEESGLPAMEIDLLLIAAWFHDTGYIVDYDSHEQYSEQIALNWLAESSLNKLDQSKIIACIRATQMPQRPHTLLEEIMCDADLIHLSTEEYEQKAALLHKEWKCIRGLNPSPKEWMISNLDFLTNHQYFTLYGQQILEVRKERNICNLLAALSPV